MIRDYTKLKLTLAVIVIVLVIGFLIFSLLNKGKESYQKVSYTKTLSGESISNIINASDGYMILSDYASYTDILSKVEECSRFEGTDKKKFDESFFDKNQLLAVECAVTGQSDIKTEILSIEEKDTVANIKISLESSRYTTDVSGDIYFIPVSKNIQSANIEIEKNNDDSKFDLENLA